MNRLATALNSLHEYGGMSSDFVNPLAYIVNGQVGVVLGPCSVAGVVKTYAVWDCPASSLARLSGNGGKAGARPDASLPGNSGWIRPVESSCAMIVRLDARFPFVVWC